MKAAHLHLLQVEQVETSARGVIALRAIVGELAETSVPSRLVEATEPGKVGLEQILIQHWVELRGRLRIQIEVQKLYK